MRLDLVDKKILCELDLNCRTSISRIAKKLRISRDVAGYRIKGLEKEGVISKYITAVNLGMLGYQTRKIYFRIWSGQEEEKEFVSFLVNHKQTISVLKTEGSFDYSVAIAVKNIHELEEFLMKVRNDFKSLVKDYTVSIVVYSRIFKLNKLLLHPKYSELKVEKYEGESKDIEMDDKDVTILKVLSQNANMSLVDLSKKTKLSLDVVKYRVRHFDKNFLLSHRIMLDFEKIGYYQYVIMLRIRQATYKDENMLAEWCHQKNNVLFFNKRIAVYDFEINVAITNLKELTDFITELKQRFGGMISSYDTMLKSKLLKLNYVPF
ncbi:MAG: Lrp/AsnC family transcriptional regulator [Nanoarchaeota archaeon]|nr:Lrp/AsnC family transcriptional regulator [Nanoarchaeota archaeon]